MLGQNADELAAWVTAISGWRTQANSVNISLDTVQLTLPDGSPLRLDWVTDINDWRITTS